MTEASGEWLAEVERRHESQLRDIKLLAKCEHLGEEKLRALDSSLKKLTSFMKKVKGVGSTTSAASLLPELEKLNVSKFLDEIATHVCEAKIKLAEVPSLVEFCVQLTSMYEGFASVLLNELKKHIPTKRSDVVANPSKLRVDIKYDCSVPSRVYSLMVKVNWMLRLVADLCLHGVLGEGGIKLIGSALAYLVNTDKVEHVNVSVLMPFCRIHYFDFTGRLPLSQRTDGKEGEIASLKSSLFTDEQISAIVALFEGYFGSIVEHLKQVNLEMRSLHKSIARQERTRGDAPAEDRQKYEQLKSTHDKLAQNVADLSECLGVEVPLMLEAPSSEDENEAAAAAVAGGDRETAGAEAGKLLSVWNDTDTRNFYERLVDVRRFIRLHSLDHCNDDESESKEDEAEEREKGLGAEEINVDIDKVELDELALLELSGEEELSQPDGEGGEAHNEEDGEDEEEGEVSGGDANARGPSPEDEGFFTEMLLNQAQPSSDMKEFLKRMTVPMNREFIDQLAIEYLTRFNTKANKKRLIAHLLEAPKDRFDLLPFYGRFLATVKNVLPEVTKQVEVGLLAKFRELIKRGGDAQEEGAKKKTKDGASKKGARRTDEKVHLSRYLAELTKFAILPKAEALTCLRALLVDLRSFKVEMLSAMVESVGVYLLRSPSSRAKMEVIMEVMRKKGEKIKDSRHKILIDNAYYSVYPPEEKPVEIHPLQPLKEFLQSKLTSDKCTYKFRKINWDDPEISDFALRLLCNPSNVRFEELEKLASLVSSLSEYHDWIGIRVVDEILEFIRLSLEVSSPSLQQRTYSSVSYLGQLYIYKVCNSSVIIRVLYQLISFGLPHASASEWPMGVLIVRMQRARLALQLADTVGEFFTKGVSKKRMDTFLCHLLLFHHVTADKWIDYEEQLGDYPTDIADSVDELLKSWRRDGRRHFPKTADQATECISKAEKQFLREAEELMRHGLQSVRDQLEDGEDLQRSTRLNRIAEEGEDDLTQSHLALAPHFHTASAIPTQSTLRCEPNQGEMSQPSSESSNTGRPASVYDVPEEKVVEVKSAEDLQEDEAFAKDFDRLVLDTMKSAPVTYQGPTIDLEVPPLAKQKFEKKITFAPDTHGKQAAQEPTNDGQRPFKIALMTRGRDHRAELKPVQLEATEGMLESWRQHDREKEDERLRLKKATLAMCKQQSKKKRRGTSADPKK